MELPIQFLVQRRERNQARRVLITEVTKNNFGHFNIVSEVPNKDGRTYKKT